MKHLFNIIALLIIICPIMLIFNDNDNLFINLCGFGYILLLYVVSQTDKGFKTLNNMLNSFELLSKKIF